MKLEELKGKVGNWWKSLKPWEKGAVVGAIIYLIYLAVAMASVWNPSYGIKEVLQVILLFLLISFGMFGLGFKFSEKYNTYVKKGAFIGAYLPLLPLIILILIPCSGESCFAKFSGILLFVLLIPILAGLGGLVGYIYTKAKEGI